MWARFLSGKPADRKRLSGGGRTEAAGNTATGWLKLLALIFMFIDHSGKVLFNNLQGMRILGRAAFPLYLWCMVVGFERTRSVPRYLFRILLVGVISQPLYVLALDTQGHIGTIISEVAADPDVLNRIFLVKPNVFLTLLLGLAALWGIREKKLLSQIWAPALAIALATSLKADYGWRGVTLLIMLYVSRNSRPAIASVMVAFFLFWGSSYPVFTSLFGVPIKLSSLPEWLNTPLNAFLRLETFALLSLPLILIRFPRDLRLPKWVSYALYPGHLVLLILLKIIFYGW